LRAHIHAVPGYYPCLSREDIVAIAINEVCRCSRGGEAPHLFRTEGNPYPVLQALPTCLIGSDLSVITAAKADKTGADKINGYWGRHDGEIKVVQSVIEIF
jgi:hypothetical protein